jgi:hypothetical protein
MKRILYSFLLQIVTVSLATTPFNPQPIKRTPAEVEFRSALEKEGNPAQRMQIAQDFVTRFPDDIPLGRLAADELKKGRNGQSWAATFFKKLSEDHPGMIGPQYYYARVADDTLVWEETARFALAQDSTNSWAWLMWMAAEWHKTNPDMEHVRERVIKSIMLDPSRPEGYMFLGQWFEEKQDTVGAIEAYMAGLVCDPEHSGCKKSLEFLAP